MRFGSVCSGIEAASVAWEPLGWEPAWFAEIEPFPCEVLKERFPNVPNYGDFTKMLDPSHEVHNAPPIDLLVGGCPCQDFSVAGLRAGIEGARGHLTLAFLQLARILRPRWLVYENVPGLLTSDGGRAFGAFLGGLEELGYGWSYRTLDAQYVRVEHYSRAVPQRRRRVFVVGHSGADWLRPASVLLEPEGSDRDSVPRRTTREEAAAALGDGLAGGRWAGAERPGAEQQSEGSEGDGGRGGVRGHGVDAVAIQDVRGFDKAQNGRGWNADGSAYTLDTHATQGVALESLVFRDPCPTLTARMQGSSGWAPYNEDAHLVGQATAPSAGFSGIDVQNVLLTGEITGTLQAQGTGRAGSCEMALLYSDDARLVGQGSVPGARSGGSHWDSARNPHPTLNQSSAAFGGIGASNQEVFGQRGGGIVPEVAPTLTAANNPSRSPQSSEVTAQVEAVLNAEAYRAQYWDGSDTAQTLMTNPCAGQANYSAVLQPICARESGQGYWMEDTVAGTLRAEGENRPSRPSHMVGLVSPVAGTLDANYGKGTGERNGAEREVIGEVAQPPVWRASGQANAETLVELAGTLNCNIGQSGGILFSPQERTFRKAGRAQSSSHAETWVEASVCNTLNTFDSGETRATVVAIEAVPAAGRYTMFTGDGAVADPITANEGKTYTHEGTTFRMHNCVGEHVGFYPTAGQDFPALNGCSPAVKVGSGGSAGNPPGIAMVFHETVSTYREEPDTIAFTAEDEEEVAIMVAALFASEQAPPAPPSDEVLDEEPDTVAFTAEDEEEVAIMVAALFASAREPSASDGPPVTNWVACGFDTYNYAVSAVSQTLKSPSGGVNESIGTVCVPKASHNHWETPHGVHPTLCAGGHSHPGQSLQDVLHGAGLVLDERAEDGQPLGDVLANGVSNTCTAKWSKGTGGYAGVNEYDNCVLTYEAQAIGSFKPSPVAGTMLKHTGMGAGETTNPAFVLTGSAQAYRVQGDCGTVLSSPTADTLRCRRPGEGGLSGDDTHLVVPDISPALNTQSGQHHAPCTKAYVAKFSVASAPPMAFAQNQLGEVRVGEVFNTLNTNANASGRNTAMVAHPEDPSVAFNGYQRTEQDVAWPIGASDGRKVEVGVRSHMAVRRLTPVECERLMGFPDGWTQIAWRKKPASECPDGPRYKALGNSMAVNCMRFIGERIALIEDTFAELEGAEAVEGEAS